jgi:hypothetical protein
MRLRQAPGGTWYIITYKSPGRQTEISTHTKDRAEAEAILRRMSDGDTLAGNIEQFLDYSRTNHKPSTTQRCQYALQTFKKFVGSLTHVKDITPAKIERYKVFRKNAIRQWP